MNPTRKPVSSNSDGLEWWDTTSNPKLNLLLIVISMVLGGATGAVLRRWGAHSLPIWIVGTLDVVFMAAMFVLWMRHRLGLGAGKQ